MIADYEKGEYFVREPPKKKKVFKFELTTFNVCMTISLLCIVCTIIIWWSYR